MTPKDRITAAFRNEKPDRVPVSPELWDVIPIKVSGRPFYEFGGTSFGITPLWQAQLDAYRFFGCEAWIPVEPGPSKKQTEMVQSKSAFIDSDSIKTDVLYKTSKGELKEIKHSCFDFDLWSAEQPVEDIYRDFPIIEDCFFEDPENLDYSTINEAYDKTADSGICEGIVGNTFFEFLTLYRKGGAVQVIFDLHEHPDFFRELRDKYMRHLVGIAEEICLRTEVDGIFVNCGSATLTVTGPSLFNEWDIPVIEAVGNVAKKYGRVFHYHLHGRGRILLDCLVNSEVNMLCPLENPPKGDFDLAEVKKTFGDRLALKGGIDPFVLRDTSKEELEKMVKYCIESASGNGGYTLATGDGVLKETPFENIRYLVELTEKYGVY